MLALVLQILAIHAVFVESDTSVFLFEDLGSVEVVDDEFLLIIGYQQIVDIIQQNYEEHLNNGFGVHG
jgi:hypothetical protein